MCIFYCPASSVASDEKKNQSFWFKKCDFIARRMNECRRLEYELPARLVVKSDQLLGSGNFGEVWLGKIFFPETISETENAALFRLVKSSRPPPTTMTTIAGKMNGTCIPTAIKTAKQDCVNAAARQRQIAAIMAEIDILCTVGAEHDNVLQLLGAVTTSENQAEFFMLTEYCVYGSLDKFLLGKKADSLVLSEIINKRKSSVISHAEEEASAAAPELELYLTEVNIGWLPTRAQMKTVGYIMTGDLLSYACQIADGMQYLHSKMIIHRDLALRNILLNHRHCVKIADFGLSRQVTDTGTYLQHSADAIPAPWTAPEVLRTRTASIESDYWTYGILLWELFYLGAKIPYSGFGFAEILTAIESGYRLEPPPFAPSATYVIMQQLWHKDPHLRMTLDACRRLIGDEFQRCMNKTGSTATAAYYLSLCESYETDELFVSPYLKQRLVESTAISTAVHLPEKMVKFTVGSRLSAAYLLVIIMAVAVACVFAGLYFASIRKRSTYANSQAEYRYFDMQQDFISAAYECFLKNGFPPIIRDAQENQFILEKYLEFSDYQKSASVSNYVKMYYWLGAQRMGKYQPDSNETARFTWVDDITPMNYTNWRRWEPNQVGNEDCVVMDEEGKWYDRSCKQTHPWLCVYKL